MVRKCNWIIELRNCLNIARNSACYRGLIVFKFKIFRLAPLHYFLRYTEYFQLFYFTTSYPDIFGPDYEVTVRQEEQKKVLAHIELTLSNLQYFPIVFRNEWRIRHVSTFWDRSFHLLTCYGIFRAGCKKFVPLWARKFYCRSSRIRVPAGKLKCVIRFNKRFILCVLARHTYFSFCKKKKRNALLLPHSAGQFYDRNLLLFPHQQSWANQHCWRHAVFSTQSDHPSIIYINELYHSW